MDDRHVDILPEQITHVDGNPRNNELSNIRIDKRLTISQAKLDSVFIRAPMDWTLIARTELHAEELTKRCVARGRTDLKVRCIEFGADMSDAGEESIVVDDFYAALAEDMGCSRVEAKSRCLLARYSTDLPDCGNAEELGVGHG